ncbi:arginine decarboxylase [Brumimicrobium salinarum]|uniref:Arginine decarboxylase n=1 Tax=Brumimicrobium salinarum TaxID=2058658 RepID=A0A2I0R0B7_9FLAO|nr:arginine decarboxylase [Brumimicrobium salinarum]PKR80017.1 arginine decarboxylase [Brumimicrobium salinarum]
MKNKYQDLIEQTFDFPQEEFSVENGELSYRGIDMNALIEKYGTPFRFTYLPVIGKQIERCRNWFHSSMKKQDYKGKYEYCYCTKSSHFNFVLEECTKHKTNIETSSAFDIDILIALHKKGKLDKDTYVLCNGYKTEVYIKKIKELLELGFTKVIPVIDNFQEFDILDEQIDQKLEIGIRIASEEDPKFEFYTSRLGIGYKDVVSFYNWKLKDHKKFKLSMLHFFVNTGIRDNAYYWNELHKFLSVYENLIKNDADITYLNVGGGFPVKNSLAFDFDYEYLVDEIIGQIKMSADHVGAIHPDIFTEFGSFTVAEAGGMVYTILDQKKQNDREKWNMINSSFMTTLPDSWAINKRFIMLPINRWNEKYERVFLGGLTCDSDDYYNSEQHVNAIYLPVWNKKKPMHVGFFNCGAYQESISGYGGIKHCLIPSPKHILLSHDENGELVDELFAPQQTSEEMLKILGY